MTKKVSISLIAFLLILLAGIGYYFAVYKPNITAGVCASVDDKVMSEAAVALQPADREKMRQLSKVVKKIQNAKGYENHFNCVYPVVAHYIYIGDSENAKTHYEYLKKAQENGQSLSDIYNYRVTIEEIKAQIDYLDISKKETIDNALVF